MVGEERGRGFARRDGYLIAIGCLAGVGSGLLGVGGGTVMVPLLATVAGLSQHRAHATSLAAIVPIAAVAAAVFGVDGRIEYDVALPLAAGALLGAPLGARVMAGTRESTLQACFGLLLVATGAAMVFG